MGLFDWLLGRKKPIPVVKQTEPESQPKQTFVLRNDVITSDGTLARPANVKWLDESGMICIVEQNGLNILLDSDAFEYTYGKREKPGPSQRDLDDLWQRVTRVCVLEGYCHRGRPESSPIMVHTIDPAAIQKLKECLTIVEDPSTFNHCSCLGGPTIELYANQELLACIGIHHGKAIRWKAWHDDAQLVAGDQLTQWLISQDIGPKQLQAIYDRRNHFVFEEQRPLTPEMRQADELVRHALEARRANRPDMAQEFCSKAIEIQATHFGAYIIRGDIHYDNGRKAEAYADYSLGISLGFRKPEIISRVGVLLDDMGRTEEALLACHNALLLDSDNSTSRTCRGLIRLRQGNLDEASADFTVAIKSSPEWAVPWMHRGMVLHQRGQMNGAIKDYEKAIQLATDGHEHLSPDTRNYLLATLYCRRGDARIDLFQDKDAEADFARARDKHQGTALQFQGEMWMRRGNLRQAMETITQYLSLFPQDSAALLLRGQAREGLRDLDNAEADYTAALSHNNQSPARLLRARVRAQTRRFPAALKDLQEYLERFPDDMNALLLRSQLLRQTGQYAPSLQDKVRLHQLAPDQPDVCNSLAWLLATCPEAQYRDGPRAVSLARHACEVTKYTNSHLLDTLAAALAEAGEFEEAARWQSIALNLTPPEQAAGRKARLELYHTRQPYRECLQE